MKYQSKQHVIESAQAAGSTAQTYKGATRYLIDRARNRTPLHKRGTRNPWQRDERHKQHYLAATRRDTRYTAKGEAICAAAGLWTLDRAQDAAKIANDKYRAARVAVPLGSATAAEISQGPKKQHPNHKNWDTPEALTTRTAPGCHDINHGRYSSRCTYTHWTYQPVVGSWAIIIWDGRLEYNYGADHRAYLSAPRGYHWDIDKNGVRLVANRDARIDYHPDSDDLRNYSPTRLVSKMLGLYSQRKAALKQAAEEMRLERLSADERTRLIAKAEREGAMVCLVDSLRAGNCLTGTISFAERHQLDPRKHYRPSQLLKIANGSADRVKLAVYHALRRHRREMQQGYALLADHYREAAA